MGKTIAERLADYGASLEFGSIPGEAVHEAKRRVIDSFACMLGAFDSPPARVARSVAPRVASGPSATMLGVPAQTTPGHAAFVNGVLVRYLDYNDTYLSLEPAHPSDNIPAALAAAEASGSGGKALLTAIIAAYEVQCRLCDAAALRPRGWDHVTYGAFSATLAAAIAMGLGKNETINALGIAGADAPALRQTRAGELSMWKGSAFANAARNALFAASLAAGGMTGPAPIFEGEFGLERVVSGPLTLPSFGGEEGATGFRITDTYIKCFPAEYHSLTAIEAASWIAAEIDDAAEIESVKVRTFRAAYEIIGSGPERWAPSTRETADHSLPFLTAAALMDGRVTASTFSERLGDQRLLSLAKKVSVEVDPDLDRMYPEAVPNRVEVRLKSGRMLTGESIFPKGHPRNPMTDKEVEDKFRALSAWCFAPEQAGRILSALWKIDKEKDLKGMMGLFAR